MGPNDDRQSARRVSGHPRGAEADAGGRARQDRGHRIARGGGSFAEFRRLCRFQSGAGGAGEKRRGGGEGPRNRRQRDSSGHDRHAGQPPGNAGRRFFQVGGAGFDREPDRVAGPGRGRRLRRRNSNLREGVMKKLSEAEIQAALLPEWRLKDGKLHREYKFADFPHAFGFMATAAPMIEKMDHHPAWSNVYNRVLVELWTHDAGGITQKDLDLAAVLENTAKKLL